MTKWLNPALQELLQELNVEPVACDERGYGFYRLCEDLTTVGIGYIVADYDGSGDDGCISGVSAYRNKEDRCSWNTLKYQSAVNLPAYLNEQLETFVDTLLEYAGADFNGDGCMGHIEIDLVAGAIHINHNDRYTHYETTDHVLVAKPVRPGNFEKDPYAPN